MAESASSTVTSEVVSPGRTCSTSAAAVAATGAAAEVPKNGSITLVAAPSGARKLGTAGVYGEVSLVPSGANRISPGPALEYGSGVGVPPSAGVSAMFTAP